MNLNYVRFDVGHYLHTCHKQTLQKYPASALARFVSPEFDTRKTGDDYIVIDRDGKHFGAILNFMRDGSSLNLESWTNEDLIDLMREADFYCLGELVDYCEQELVRRNHSSLSAGARDFVVPAKHKLETIYSLTVMKELLNSVLKPTIVISQRAVKRFNIEPWFAELVKFCDHDRFNVYCFANKNSEANICDTGPTLNLRNFIVALYEPSRRKFEVWIETPSDEKFRARRAHYKCKIFKFWFVVQNDMLQALEDQQQKQGSASHRPKPMTAAPKSRSGASTGV